MMSLASIFLLNINIFIYPLLFLWLAILLFFDIRNNQCRELQWQPDGGWLIDHRLANLLPGSVITYFFAALRFKLEDKSIINVIIFKDNIDMQKFRQLRVRLKVEGLNAKPEISTLTDN